MSSNAEKKRQLNKVITDNLELAQRSGMAAGMYAAGKVVYEKLTDENKPIEDRLADAIGFCQTCMQINSKDAAQNGGDGKNA